MDEQGYNRPDNSTRPVEEDDFILEQPGTQTPPDPSTVVGKEMPPIFVAEEHPNEDFFVPNVNDTPPFVSNDKEAVIYTTEAETPVDEKIFDETTEQIEVEIPQNPVEEQPSEATSEIKERIDNLTSAIDNLTSGLNERFAKATHSTELFDKMYSEMASYKDDLYAKLLKPFILEAITILEDYRRTLDRIDTLTLDQIRKTLKNIPADIEDLLENNGVDILISDGENQPYDRKVHQIIRTVETEDPELDGRIAKNLRPGYAWNGSIIRQEKVEVYKLKK